VKSKALILGVILAVLVVPALSLAGDGSPAYDACKAEYVQLGPDAFAAKYGPEPMRACVEAHGGTTTVTTTQSETTPAGTETNGTETETTTTETETTTTTTTESRPADTTGVPTTGDDAVVGVAARLCELEYQRLGADAFTAKYGTGDAGRHACLQAKRQQAQAIVASCKAGSAADFEQCVKQALGVPTEKPKPAAYDDKTVKELARALCVAERWSLGRDAFVAKYGANEPFAVCVKATQPKVRATLAACKARSGGNRDAFKQCVVAALKKRTK